MKILYYLFDRDKLRFGLPVILFGTFTVFFYGPLGTYLSNTDEFSFAISPVLKITGCVSALVFAILFLTLLVLPTRISRWVFQLGFGISLAMYLQAATNISYGSGVMDGSEIVWSDYTAYAVKNTIMWVICILAPFMIGALRWNKKARVVPLVALFLTAIQIPAMAVQLVNYEPSNATKFVVTNKDMLKLGNESNFIVIVLDTMDEAYYDEFIEANPDYTENLTGFVHYDNMLASGARTMLGMPSLLTGTPFYNQSTFSDYVNKVWTEENPILDISKTGTQVDIYSDDAYYSSAMVDYVDNYESTEAGEEELNLVKLAKTFYKLDGFIYLPHLLKHYCWIDTADFNQAKDTDTAYYVNDANFHWNLWNANYEFQVSDDVPSMFKLYHMTGAHSPYLLNEYGVQDEDATRESQVEGVFYIVNKMLENLKAQGLYDSSTILITADHGEEDVYQHSFMMLKKPGATQAYSDSSVPASAFDIAYYMYEAYGLEVPDSAKVYGKSLDSLTEDEVRERHVFVNTRNEGASFLVTEYVTAANLNEPYEWDEVNEYTSVNLASTPYTLGTTLSFQADATANVYCTEGVTGTTGWNSPFYGRYSVIQLPLEEAPSKGSINATFTLGHASYIKDNIQCNIYLNDVLSYSGQFTKDMAKTAFTVSADAAEVFADRKDCLEIRFEFPEVSEDEMYMPLEERTQTIALWDMCVSVDK